MPSGKVFSPGKGDFDAWQRSLRLLRIGLCFLCFISKIRDAAPALPEVVGGQLGPAVPGEQALLIAVHPHGALDGGKVGEVPHLFPDKEGPLVQLGVDAGIVIRLV